MPNILDHFLECHYRVGHHWTCDFCLQGLGRVHERNARLERQLAVLRDAQRPWVGAPEIKVEQSADGKLTFKHSFKNVGHSPTKGLWIDGKIIPGESIETELAKLCPDRLPQDNKDFSLIPENIWPLDLNQMPSGGSPISLENFKLIPAPHIIECILYGSPFDKNIHVTKILVRMSIHADLPSIEFVYPVEAN